MKCLFWTKVNTICNTNFFKYINSRTILNQVVTENIECGNYLAYLGGTTVVSAFQNSTPVSCNLRAGNLTEPDYIFKNDGVESTLHYWLYDQIEFILTIVYHRLEQLIRVSQVPHLSSQLITDRYLNCVLQGFRRRWRRQVQHRY